MGSELGVTAATKPGLDLSPVSLWLASLAAVWTFAVALGFIYLIINRNHPILRIRGLGLSLTSIFLLHSYWAPCQFGLMLAAVMPGDTTYWMMGILLPFGIALFHASNARFLHVAKLQRRYAQHGRLIEPSTKNIQGGLIGRYRRLNYTAKILVPIGIAMVFQLFLTVLIYLISRKWHSSWGIPGTEVHGTAMEKSAAQGTGWEWWPTCFFQSFWSWVVAPIVLWKARNIHDTQGWRIQTVGCAIAGLHGTPMWLIGINVPGMAPVNKYFIPPQWICVSIMFIEIFTVFLPCWEVMRSQYLRQETLDSIARWEQKVKGSSHNGKSIKTESTMVESIMSGFKSTNDSVKTASSNACNRDSILTMSALEYVLDRNPAPLQQFSAYREFSGENIVFLTSVAEWKNALPTALRDPATAANKDVIRNCFNRALHIYAEFISVRHAEFPVNISHVDLKNLEHIFETPTTIVYGEEREVNPTSPFDKFTFDLPSPAASSGGSEKAIMAEINGDIKDRVAYWGEIPEEFGATVFDDAEASIKYLVLTNTWPKFIKHRRTSTDSYETLQAGMEIV